MTLRQWGDTVLWLKYTALLHRQVRVVSASRIPPHIRLLYMAVKLSVTVLVLAAVAATVGSFVSGMYLSVLAVCWQVLSFLTTERMLTQLQEDEVHDR